MKLKHRKYRVLGYDCVRKLIYHHCLCPYLMAGVYGADLTDVQVVKRHQQLCSQRAVVDIPRSQEKCSQKLQHHVVQLHVLSDHLGQL